MKGKTPKPPLSAPSGRRFPKSATRTARAVVVLLALAGPIQRLAAEDLRPPYGLPSRPLAKTYLLMPQRADDPMPPLLSQTGAFLDTRSLTRTDGLIPYDLNVPFWSDGAAKSRWVCLPTGASGGKPPIKFRAEGAWIFPNGTVFVKHFELATNEARPAQTRRLETRLLICDSTGGVFGLAYKWRPDN